MFSNFKECRCSKNQTERDSNHAETSTGYSAYRDQPDRLHSVV